MPPDPVQSGGLLDGLNLDNRRIKVVDVGPLWQSDLLPQIYVRRAIEAVPQVATHPEDVGILLVARGHISGPDRNASSNVRQEQELAFQRRVRQALVKLGFAESRIAYAWLRGQQPNPILL